MVNETNLFLTFCEGLLQKSRKELFEDFQGQKSDASVEAERMTESESQFDHVFGAEGMTVERGTVEGHPRDRRRIQLQLFLPK